MFEIFHNNVLTVKQVKTKKQTAIVKEFYCLVKKIMISSDKSTLMANSTDTAIVSVKWQKFNVETGQFEDDSTNADLIRLDVSGQIVELSPADRGIEFATLEPKEHVIKSLNELVENTEVVVVANA